MVPYVRLPPHSPDLINYVLNAGAGGIVMPHVQSAAQAETFVRMAKFPPLGDRSYPPMALFGKQAMTRDGETVYDVWNGHAAVFCQIEDVEGVKNVEEIARVPGGKAWDSLPLRKRLSSDRELTRPSECADGWCRRPALFTRSGSRQPGRRRTLFSRRSREDPEGCRHKRPGRARLCYDARDLAS